MPDHRRPSPLMEDMLLQLAVEPLDPPVLARRGTNIRRALVPAAGRGARLDRAGTPKPLVEIGGMPMIVRVLAQLADAGVDEAVVIVGHGAPAVRRALTDHPRLSRVRVR